ncbi:MAG: hypothetical protein C0501_29995 [Isosphaera sp.]|nr:hypothetical protein [Isosphaera sp.]
MPRLLAVAVLSVVGLGAAPVPPDGGKPAPYLPARKGTTWVYAYDGGEVTYVVTAVEEKDGCKLVTQRRVVDDGGMVFGTKVSVSDKGLYLVDTRDGDLDSPLPLLKLPAKAGDKWEVSVDRPKKLTGVVTVAGVEEVKVPAGAYTAVRVEWKYTLDGASQSRTYWYAPGVGLVKQHSRTKDLESELALKAFTLPRE